MGGRMGSERILGRLVGGVQSGSSWLRIGADGSLVQMVVNLQVLVPWS
jgi:hypothetical protein